MKVLFPLGNEYVSASDIEFEVLEDGSVTEVEMKDGYSKTEISKTDITTGKELEGAKLQILDPMETNRTGSHLPCISNNIYFQLSNYHYPIEIQYNTYYDRQLNNWLHKYIYKRDYNNMVGCTLRKEYESGKIKTENEFKEVLNCVLSDSKKSE